MDAVNGGNVRYFVAADNGPGPCGDGFVNSDGSDGDLWVQVDPCISCDVNSFTLPLGNVANHAGRDGTLLVFMGSSPEDASVPATGSVWTS